LRGRSIGASLSFSFNHTFKTILAARFGGTILACRAGITGRKVSICLFSGLCAGWHNAQSPPDFT